MSRIRGKDTSIELTVRKKIHAMGYRYRLHYGVPGKPDIAFPRYKIAVFINGCFWHMHGCNLSATPLTRTDFWVEKLGKNHERDLKNRRTLVNEGWDVITIWECQIERNPSEAITPLIQLLKSDRKSKS